jgi:hypothetical protein
MPPIKENGEIEINRPTMMPSNPIINHNHKENYDEQLSNDNINGFDSMNELIEAQKQIILLRERLNETNGNFKMSLYLCQD